jgi:hypothetical protein
LSSRKFVIDGKIEGKPESLYLRKKKVQKSKKLRLTIWILAVFSVLLVVTCILLLVKNASLNSTIRSMKKEISQSELLVKENQTIKILNDTLQKKIIQLQMDNDYLVENSENMAGIFFEVQIGNFSDFNLDEYGNELKGLHQDRVGKTSKFCLGRFRSFQKAVLFENDIRKLGIGSAFIIGRIDGKIVDYQVALKAYQQKQLN